MGIRFRSLVLSAHVAAQALLVWDVHAHLSQSPVVGYLAGTWNSEAGDLCVRAAYPVPTTAATLHKAHADMDAQAAAQVSPPPLRRAGISGHC